MKRRLLLPALLVTLASGALAACGSQPVETPGASASVSNGAELFAQRCAGCHTLKPAGAEGSATKVSDRERVDGPDFDVRKVCYADALYAVRNGGYSGAIMPENIIVGKDAEDVAAFLEEYSGKDSTVAAEADGSKPECPPLPAGAGE